MKPVKILIITMIHLLALGLYFYYIPICSADMSAYNQRWYDAIVAGGGFQSLTGNFYNYSPAYLYLVAAVSYLRLPSIIAIKLINIIFIFLTASLAYQIIGIFSQNSRLKWFGYSLILFTPTIFINAVVWGQTDILYTAALLTCIFFFCTNRPLPAIISFSIAFALKLQSAFLAPLLLILCIKKKLPWLYLGIIPGIFILTIFPVALMGKPLNELVGVYLTQANTYPELNKNAPNLWGIFPGTDSTTGFYLGFALAAASALLMTWIAWKGQKELKPEQILLTAALSVVVLPFFLPRMHERYFFAADVITILLAFALPRLKLVPFAMQASSIAAYTLYLIDTAIIPLSVASSINAVVITILAYAYYKMNIQKNLINDLSG